MKLDAMNEKWIYYFELLAINLLWIAAVFDPTGNVFGLRYVALVLIYVTFLLQIFNKRLCLRLDGTCFSLLAYFVLILPAYGLLVYYFRGGVVRLLIPHTSVPQYCFFVLWSISILNH